MNHLFNTVLWKSSVALFAVGLFLSSCYTVVDVSADTHHRIVKMKRATEYIYITDPYHTMDYGKAYTPKQIRNLPQ